MTICDCALCACWMPAWPDSGETRCYDCVIGKHNRLDDDVVSVSATPIDEAAA